MNIREGIRRLALAAGALGAAAGSVVSFMGISSLNEQRARYNEFRALLSKPGVQKDLELLKTGLQGAKDETPAFKYAHHGQDWFDAVAAVTGSVEGWTVGEDGVTKILFGKDGEVSSITNDKGDRVYPTASVAAWEYLLVLGWPVLGFIVPWGILRTVGWIISGFSHKPN